MITRGNCTTTTTASCRRRSISSRYLLSIVVIILTSFHYGEVAASNSSSFSITNSSGSSVDIQQQQQQQQPSILPPQLNGRHFNITIIPDTRGFVDFVEHVDEETGKSTATYSGYLIDILEAISNEQRANFTYSFKTPSGYGSRCSTTTGGESPEEPYLRKYWGYYECATSDVTDVPHTQYTTDMYVGTFYVTPERQLLNQFTIPFFPPTTGTQVLVGTATNIHNIHDFVQKQEQGEQRPACVVGNTAYSKFVRQIFPTLQLIELMGGDDIWHQALSDRTCDVVVVGYPFATSFVKSMANTNRCYANNMVRILRITSILHFITYVFLVLLFVCV